MVEVECVINQGVTRWKIVGTDILHREDGPAVIYPAGTKIWYQYNLKHRTDGPAVEFSNGNKCWYLHDKFHRLDGPAVEYTGDEQDQYWIQGIKYTMDHFNIIVFSQYKQQVNHD